MLPKLIQSFTWDLGPYILVISIKVVNALKSAIGHKNFTSLNLLTDTYTKNTSTKKIL